MVHQPLPDPGPVGAHLDPEILQRAERADTRAQQMRSSDSATLAARAAERAWSLRHTPETAWNRAVALDTPEAWRDYLALDETSDWAREAQAHLAR